MYMQRCYYMSEADYDSFLRDNIDKVLVPMKRCSWAEWQKEKVNKANRVHKVRQFFKAGLDDANNYIMAYKYDVYSHSIYSEALYNCKDCWKKYKDKVSAGIDSNFNILIVYAYEFWFMFSVEQKQNAPYEYSGVKIIGVGRTLQSILCQLGEVKRISIGGDPTYTRKFYVSDCIGGSIFEVLCNSISYENYSNLDETTLVYEHKDENMLVYGLVVKDKFFMTGDWG